MPPEDPLDLIPDPGDIHRRIAAVSRALTILRRLLRLAVAARRAREAGQLNNVIPAREVSRG